MKRTKRKQPDLLQKIFGLHKYTKETNSKTKMGLENTFGKAEKVEEKKLEVIASVDSVVDDLRAYFEKSTPSNFDAWEGDFKSYMDYLQTFRITPKMITKINEKLPKQSSTEYRVYKSIFISALIQTSYNQGNNSFIFNKINADSFGRYLKGKKDDKIRIKAETLEGDFNLRLANYCLIEIQNYQGRAFGRYMKNCTIKSGNGETLETIKEQVGERGNNRFELKK